MDSILITEIEQDEWSTKEVNVGHMNSLRNDMNAGETETETPSQIFFFIFYLNIWEPSTLKTRLATGAIVMIDRIIRYLGEI